MFLFAMKQVMNIRQTNILYFLYELEIKSIKQVFGARFLQLRVLKFQA